MLNFFGSRALLRNLPSIRTSNLYHCNLRGLSTRTPRRPPTRTPMDFNAGPMVWIDCEMTGLDHRKDKIIEIAVIVTNGNLELMDDGIEYIIKTDKKYLDGMDEWCTEQHGRSGLTKACLESPHDIQFVTQKVLEYIKKWIPLDKVGVLAGNSVHVDRMFLDSQMTEVVNWLHYRIVDVSSIKELSRRWYGKYGVQPRPASQYAHRALDDIRASIEELRWYRENIFRSQTAVKSSVPSPKTR